MAQIEILKDVSLNSLTEKMPVHLASIWQQGHQRTQILILIQRHHRQKFEDHAKNLSLNHPCWSLFYRPRNESEDIEERGFNPKSASFMFLDVALEDLGKWVGPLVKDDWLREEVIITPSSESEDYPSTKWTMFRDPWLSELEVLPLATAPHEIIAKAWVTSPSVGTPVTTSQTVSAPSQNTPPEAASDNAFAGKLAGLTHSFGAAIAATAAPTTASQQPSENSAPAIEVAATPAPIESSSPAFVMPSGPVSIPGFGGVITTPSPSAKPTSETSLSPTPVEVPAPTSQPAAKEISPPESPSPTPQVEKVTAPSTAPVEGQDIREELVDTIQLLRAGGLEAEQIMESPAFQEVSERATAAGLDVWSIFVSNAS